MPAQNGQGTMLDHDVEKLKVRLEVIYGRNPRAGDLLLVDADVLTKLIEAYEERGEAFGRGYDEGMEDALK